MRPSLRTATHRVGFGLASVAGLGTAFSLGVVAGAGSRLPDRDTAAPAGILDDAADEIAGNALNPVDRQALDAAAMKAMLSAAGDQWGGWAAGATSTGAYAGIGLWLRRERGVLLVSQVSSGSPAQQAGVRVGDELRSVDDRTTRGRAVAEVISALRGLPGTSVTLVLRRGSSLRSLSLTRAQALEMTYAMLSKQVGGIIVPSFTQGVGRQVRDAVRDLTSRHVSGIVLDLRGDPGGLLSEAVETASAFLDGGHVVTYSRRDEKPQQLDAEGKGETSTPLVVLVDGGTASAAEVVAGALQDRGRAVIVGSRTFGKGSVQEPHTLLDGSSLALTVARYTLPSGRSVEGVGIEPDIEVSDGASDAAAVKRAVEVLLGLRADTGGGSG